MAPGPPSRPPAPSQRRALTVLAVVVGMGLVSLAAWDRSTSARALRIHPAPGRLVDVGGHKLHLLCAGAGSPTVVFESGGGGSSLSWGDVFPIVASQTLACVYDRAGAAWSDPSPDSPTAEHAVQDLRKLLRNAGTSGPFLVVGHSLGGLFAQHFAFRHPGEIAGLVLVDAPHPDLDHRSSRAVESAERKLSWLATIMAPAASIGLARLLGISSVNMRSLAPEERARVEAVAFRAAWFRVSGRELASFDESCAQVRGARRPLAVPVEVLEHGRHDAILPFLSEAAAAEHDRLFHELQRDLAALSPLGRLTTVPGAGHLIQAEQPGAVIDSIRRVLAATDKKTSSSEGSLDRLSPDPSGRRQRQRPSG